MLFSRIICSDLKKRQLILYFMNTNEQIFFSLCCRGLDYDFIQGRKYEFQVTATDKGTPAKTGSTSVRIWMKNVNDRSPVFDPPEQRVMRVQLTIKSFIIVTARNRSLG